MIDIEYDAVYPQEPATVFAALTDFGGLPRWQQDVLESSLVSAGLELGAKIHQVRKVMGRRTEIELTVSELVPGEVLTLQTADGVKPGVRQTYKVIPDGTSTRVAFHLQLDGVPRMAEHLAKAQLGKQVPQMFTRLGDVITTAANPTG